MPSTKENPFVDSTTRFDGGISEFSKNARSNEYRFGQSIDYRGDPHKITILPRTAKESGDTVTDLIKDGDRIGTNLYEYGNTGNIYKRTEAGVVTLEKTIPVSHGNGMKYYTEDDFLYYTSDKVIGRYGQISGTPVWVNDFLGAEGGVPLNTHSLNLEAGSSQYASRADTASLSLTGDLAIEACIKPESLPTTGNSMVLFSKWDTNTNLRSYKLEIYAVSGLFGDGSDGALTISANTTEDPIDSACSGMEGEYMLTASNASFAAGQIVYIHQTQGANAGNKQRNKIAAYTNGTITLENPLNATYTTGAQVRVLKQYTNVTINATYTAKPWNGTTGGIIGFLVSGTLSGTGTISANGGSGSFSSSGAGGTGGGFRGGQGISSYDERGYYGEGYLGASNRKATNLATDSYNGNGGGTPGFNNSYIARSGGGGGNGTAGIWGTWVVGGNGIAYGTSDLKRIVFGGGGGGGVTAGGLTAGAGGGGSGGGIIEVYAATITLTGKISANGGAGATDTTHTGSTVNHEGEQVGYAHGGGGGGGSICLYTQNGALGTNLITALGGTTGSGGGAGGVGRIAVYYLTSITGTTYPAFNSLQDNTLVTNTTYQLRLGLSSNGTLEEFLTKNCTIQTDKWYHVGVSWDASEATAEFFQDGISLGSSTGSATSLNNNTSTPAIGCDFNSSARNFFDGLIDEVRVWGAERTATQMLNNKNAHIATNEIGLVAYYKLNNDYNDSTSNANHLTATGSPVFSTDVPFSSSTTRQDLDQSLDASGNTYALQTSIAETATHRQTFTPNRDPQKSIEVNISDTGDDSDWTITVHDQQNRVIASKTVTHANLRTGDFEFIFDTVWTPIRGAEYHFHLTATTTTGTPLIVSTTSNDLETADFHTYYQFLVTDEDYHPIEQILNFLGIGNGRYLATYSASGTYDPHRLSFPPGWKVRCITPFRGFWAIGCWKGTDITKVEEGKVFFWDGISDTYIDSLPVPEGAINAMITYKGRLYISAGYHGEIVVYEGGDSTNDDLKFSIPFVENSDYIEIMPKALTVWDGLLRIGVGGISNSDTVYKGVYTYGRKLAQSPISLSYDYPISTETNLSENVYIGFLYPVGRKLAIGWQDGIAYGSDIIDPAGLPFKRASIEKDIKDYGRLSKEKLAMVVRAEFEPLRSTGETVDFDIDDLMLNGLQYISVDTMKLNKDTIRNQLTDENIALFVDVLAEMNITHISISPTMDETADYITEGVFPPTPRTAADHTKAWFDAIHAAGKKVLFRGTFNGIEGIYDFEHKVGASRFPAGTAASAATDGQTTWLGKIDDWIKNHADFWEDGDIFAPIPERTEGIFTDATAFLPDTGSGIQANYAQFYIDLKAVAEAAFTSIGKSVTCGMTANNYTEVNSGWIPDSLFTDAGIVAIDHYGSTHTVEEMDTDLRAIYTAKSLPIFLQEWSDYWNIDLDEDSRIAYLKSFYAMLADLITEGKLTGFNYWGGWAFTGESIVEFDANGNLSLNIYGQLLKAHLAQLTDRLSERVKLKYRLDRGAWQYGEIVDTEDAKEARLPIDTGIHRELEIGLDIETDLATSPTTYELSVLEDVKPTEKRF